MHLPRKAFHGIVTFSDLPIFQTEYLLLAYSILYALIYINIYIYIYIYISSSLQIF